MRPSERRARQRWRMDETADPFEAAAGRVAGLAEHLQGLVHSIEQVAVKWAAGNATPAEIEAVTRWAVPAGSAFARQADDFARLHARLRQAANLDGGPP